MAVQARGVIFAAVATMAITWLAGCGGGRNDVMMAASRPQQVQTVEEVRAFLASNPCDTPGFVATTREAEDSVAALLTGSEALENEVHDCQRLVEGQGTQRRFGALVGLFPLERAMQATRMEFSSGLASISIYNWGDWNGQPQAYDSLGIEPGWQCLFLENIGDSPTGWRAAIEPLSGRSCSTESPPAVWDLQVVEHEHVSAARYPETARWGWDHSGGEHYIGMKCGRAWCSIGASGFTPMEPASLTGPEEKSIPGWYDAQHLGVPDERTGLLRPGPWGMIFPTTYLMLHDPADLGRGFVAATIDVDGSGDQDGLTYYQEKFFLRVDGSRGASQIRLRLRRGPNGSGHAEYLQPPGHGASQFAPRLLVTPQKQHAAPGAVRWRWEDEDETAWVSCWPDCCNPRGI